MMIGYWGWKIVGRKGMFINWEREVVVFRYGVWVVLVGEGVVVDWKREVEVIDS